MSDAVAEAIRFAEEYGYSRWQEARDDYNALQNQLDETRQGWQQQTADWAIRRAQWQKREQMDAATIQALQERAEKLEAQRGTLVRRLRFMVQEYEREHRDAVFLAALLIANAGGEVVVTKQAMMAFDGVLTREDDFDCVIFRAAPSLSEESGE